MQEKRCVIQVMSGVVVAFAVISTPGRAAVLTVDLSLEDNAKVEVDVGLELDKPRQKAVPGILDLELPAKGNGDHHIFFLCPGYAAQFIRIEYSDGKLFPQQTKVKLYRTRYVVVRCAFNAKNKRTLTGPDAEEQHLALSQWTAPKYFNYDWKVWQDFSAPTVRLDYFRVASGFGCVKPAAGVSYKEMKEAPESGYRCQNIAAKKGLLLYCRVQGDRHFGLGYGKLLIEDVTETPPKDVQVLKTPK